MAASLLMFQFFNEVLNNDFQIYNELGANHQISGERGGQFFYAGFFFGSLGGCKIFFWPMLGFLLVVALLHDFFSYYLALQDFFFATACP